MLYFRINWFVDHVGQEEIGNQSKVTVINLTWLLVNEKN